MRPKPNATKPAPEQRDRVDRESEKTEKQSYSGDRATDETDATQDSALSASVQTLQDAARIALDHGIGNAHFILARAVKAFEVCNHVLLEEELPAAFGIWWNMAKTESKLPPDADFDEYLFVFLDAYARVKHPLGSNVIEIAKERATKEPLPVEAQAFSSPKLQLLLAVCYHLQKLAGDSPFFLSVRTAAKLINVRIETASAFLNGLVQKGVLVLEEKGAAGGRRASRFRMRKRP